MRIPNKLKTKSVDLQSWWPSAKNRVPFHTNMNHIIADWCSSDFTSENKDVLKYEIFRAKNHRLSIFSVETYECVYWGGRICKSCLSREVLSIPRTKLLLLLLRSKLVEWDAGINRNRSPCNTQNHWIQDRYTESRAVCVCVHEHVYFLDFKNRSAHPQAVSFLSGPRRCGFRSNKSIQCLLRVLCDVLECGADTGNLMFLFMWAQLPPLLLSRAMWSHTHWQVPISSAYLEKQGFSPLITKVLSDSGRNFVKYIRTHRHIILPPIQICCFSSLHSDVCSWMVLQYSIMIFI